MTFEPSMSRRAFLTGGVALAGGLALGRVETAWAASPTRSSTTKVYAIPFSSDLYASETPQRFTLVLQRGGKNGIQYVSGPAVEVRFKAPGSADWTPYVAMELDREGLPKGRGVYRTQVAFPAAGRWKGQARFSGTTTKFSMQLPATAAAPVIGEAAPRAASPTPSAPLGVNPICTRDPECPLHSVSLSDVIGTGRPVAAMFATPALCTSMYCGPVLDELLQVRAPYEDRITFVHVDIYKNLRGTTQSPTVTAWRLPSEPWLFTVNGAGTVVNRLDTAMGTREIQSVLDQLVTT